MIAFGSLLHAFSEWFENGDTSPPAAIPARQVLFAFAQQEGVSSILPPLLFDPAWYAATHGLSMRGKNAEHASLDHYLKVGVPNQHDPTDWFSERFYRQAYPEIQAGIEAGRWPCAYGHYLAQGVAQQRSPSERFNEPAYLGANPDVAQAVQEDRIPNGFFHYACMGRAEGRSLAATPLPPQPAAIISNPKPVSAPPHLTRDRWVVITELAMLAELEPNGKDFGFNSLGRDPQFIIQQGFPAGFCRILIHLKFDRLSAAIKQFTNFQLFLGDADGFTEANSWAFRIKDDDITLEILIFNHKDVAFIRFDPINTRASFQFKEFCLDVLPFEEGCREVLQKVLALSPERRQRLIQESSKGTAMELWRGLTHGISGAMPNQANSYDGWVEDRAIDAKAAAYLTRQMKEFTGKPTISVLMPTYRPHLPHLTAAIESVQRQVYPHWELCIVDDGSGSPELREHLTRYRDEPRIKVKHLRENVGIAAATNAALGLATGTFIGLLDHDDELAPHALFAVVRAINTAPDVDMLYTDEDKMTEDGKRFGPFFKPDWSPEFMLSCMYMCHFGVYRRALVEEVGAFRSEFDFAQDYDLALRVSAAARRILHVPDILYHWRATATSTASGPTAKPTAELAARKAVQRAIEARGLTGKIIPGPFAGTHRAVIDIPETPLVSIVIPTAARRISDNRAQWYVLDLLRSIRKKTTYPNIEIILVHNGDIEPALARKLAPMGVKLVLYESSLFNISDKMNLGVKNADGGYVLLLNDDMTVIAKDWVQEMLMWFSDPEIEGVGAKLLFPNDTVQHAGVLLLAQGPSHPYYGAPAKEPGLVGSAALVRNYSAVTGACLMVRRHRYIEVGGFDPFFRVNYNDVDFCLKIRRLGRIVYTPYAMLYHYESVSKDEAPAAELAQFNERWGDIVGFDPAYNRNLSQTSSMGEIATPARSIFGDY